MNDASLQIVSNTSLSIFFGIVIGVVLAPIIAYADQSFRKNDAFTKTNYLLIASWVLVPVFTLYFAYTLFSGHYETAKALAPLGMMIAAMIASASVMKNIAETKINEDTKHQKDEEKSLKEKDRKRLFALNSIQTIDSILSSLSADVLGNQVGSLDDDFLPYVGTIKKLIDLVFTETIIQYLNDEEREIISKLYSDFYLFYSTYEYEMKIKKDFNAMTTIRWLTKLTSDFKSITEKYIETSKEQK